MILYISLKSLHWKVEDSLQAYQKAIQAIQIVLDPCKWKSDLIFKTYPNERENGIKKQSIIHEQR